MQRQLIFTLTLIVLLTSFAGASPAITEPPKPLKVAVLVTEPFVVRTEMGYTGFAIELWETVARQLGLNYQYQEVADIPELLTKLTRGDADVAVADLAVTSERMKIIDFTQPWFDSGLKIMLYHEDLKGLAGFMRTLRDSGHLFIIGSIVLIIVLMTIALTWVDRRYDPEFPTKWSSGLAESFYHVMSLLTSGSTGHKAMFGSAGRVLAAIWLVIGVGIVTYITSTVTAIMTTNALEDRLFQSEVTKVRGVEDLKGKTVGVIVGSVAETPLKAHSVAMRKFEGIDSLMDGLNSNAVDAVLAGEASLNYFLLKHPNSNAVNAGTLVRNEKLAFALRLQSPLRVPLSKEVVAASESGFLKELHQRYFESPPKNP
jgi:ABC-type amino acid transport substrate-binding protein